MDLLAIPRGRRAATEVGGRMLAFPRERPDMMTRYVRSAVITTFPQTHAGALRGWAEGAGGVAGTAAPVTPEEGST